MFCKKKRLEIGPKHAKLPDQENARAYAEEIIDLSTERTDSNAGQGASPTRKDTVRRGRDLLQLHPLPKERYDAWRHSALEAIQAACGEDSGHGWSFVGQAQISFEEIPEHYAEPHRREELERKVKVLEAVINELPAATPEPRQIEDFWSRLHPSVVQTSKARFESGHRADAVEAALKELNSTIKEHVRKATGLEFDGADLMNRAFSPNSPVVRLADLSTEDGKNIQKGYMQIYAGAMTGIRNPKAHANVVIDETRAIHHLHLASLLYQVFDERL